MRTQKVFWTGGSCAFNGHFKRRQLATWWCAFRDDWHRSLGLPQSLSYLSKASICWGNHCWGWLDHVLGIALFVSQVWQGSRRGTSYRKTCHWHLHCLLSLSLMYKLWATKLGTYKFQRLGWCGSAWKWLKWSLVASLQAFGLQARPGMSLHRLCLVVSFCFKEGFL